MATLRELKKHLASIKMTGQLAGAMKTVSAAKFSRINRLLTDFAEYSNACDEIRERFGTLLNEVYPVKNAEAPKCIIVLGANRGLCGGYNIELYDFISEMLDEIKSSHLVVSGKHAIGFFSENGIKPAKEFIMHDVPSFDECRPMLEYVLELYNGGEISSVEIVYHQFENMLTRIPMRSVLLPLKSGLPDRSEVKSVSDDTIYVPDRITVLRSAAESCVSSDFFGKVIEAGAGYQAATLIAMRSAYDNAEESAASLETDISRQRQSEVTSNVIETAGGNIKREPENH